MRSRLTEREKQEEASNCRRINDPAMDQNLPISESAMAQTIKASDGVVPRTARSSVKVKALSGAPSRRPFGDT